MTVTTYDVRIWTIQSNKLAGGGRSYTVRWRVDKRRWKETFKTRALADSSRSDLLAAARKGEAFMVATGRPVSWQRAENDLGWYQFACEYVDMKWRDAAATYRRGIAEALTTATTALLATRRGQPDGRAMRGALLRWGFNSARRDTAEGKVAENLRWVARNTRPVSALAAPEVLRAVLDALASRIDGTVAAATVVNRKRAVLYNALDYAVERRLLSSNPITTIKWKAPKSTHVIDPRSVVNPMQAEKLLAAVRKQRRSGPGLVACYASSYYAGLRPEEAVNLRRHNILLPSGEGWGEFVLEGASPHAGKEWTDNGTNRDDRQLKHRGRGDVRRVPVPPMLAKLLTAHLDTFGTDLDGRLFRGVRGGLVPTITYNRVWRAARAAVLRKDQLATPLARTPYQLRHAAVSTWLNGGVPATQVAEWAGHSVDVLLRVYAKCIDGQDNLARRRMEESYGSFNTTRESRSGS